MGFANKILAASICGQGTGDSSNGHEKTLFCCDDDGRLVIMMMTTMRDKMMKMRTKTMLMKMVKG